MNETEITILINRKSDLDLIKQKIIDSNIQFPVYILEFENHYRISFTSDPGEWELETAILSCFPQYEFIGHPGTGRKEIRLELSRYESEFATDGWGGRNENPVNETKYLIKKTIKNDKPVRFSQKITVLFDDQEFFYQTNIIDGINKRTEERGFVLLNNFREPVEKENSEILQDRMYKSPMEAFDFGFYKIQDIAEEDFKIFKTNKKKKITEIQRVPRKIVRDFINACNSGDTEHLTKNLHPDLDFEQRNGWKTIFECSGISDFVEYSQSEEQKLCKQNLKIRSKWDIKLPYLTIGVKNNRFADNDEDHFKNLWYRNIDFTVIEGKITKVVLNE